MCRCEMSSQSSYPHSSKEVKYKGFVSGHSGGLVSCLVGSSINAVFFSQFNFRCTNVAVCYLKSDENLPIKFSSLKIDDKTIIVIQRELFS